jgi:mannose-6-phosphate isomerase-like protein (cupin superfamily)
MQVLRKEDLPFVGSSYHFVGADRGDVGVSMFLVEAPPGRGAPLHIHEYDEILMTQECRARIVVGDEIREAVSGDIVVVKARTPHGFVNIGEGILRQIDIHISPRFKQKNLGPTERSRQAMLPAG